MKIRWVRYKDRYGALYRGQVEYNPPKPWNDWVRILGVVARCEGCHDTVVSYDGTGMTWGFLQWTFKSGRLQKLLEFMKTISCYDFVNPGGFQTSLFNAVFGIPQKFQKFGFEIRNGHFYDFAANQVLLPNRKKHRDRIDAICMKSKKSAMGLADVFVSAGKEIGVAETQISFAKREFSQQAALKRKPLGKVETIQNLLDTFDPKEETPTAALFWNLWQNSPAGAYKLFLNTLKKTESSITAEAKFDALWKRLNRTTYADWGFRSRQYLESGGKNPPRILRIQNAIQEFYNLDLPLEK